MGAIGLATSKDVARSIRLLSIAVILVSCALLVSLLSLGGGGRR